MNDFYSDQAGQTEAPSAAEPVHAEPQVGGSYTRNLSTGELVKNERAAADQPDQE